LNKIFEVRSVSHGDKVYYWGAKQSLAEANNRLAERFGGTHLEWANRHHKYWWIEEIDTAELFVFPALPKPRDRYSIHTTRIESDESAMDELRVNVFDRAENLIATYDRNHPGMYNTFEPFRQGEKMFALVSSDYTATAVIDLANGKMIAFEEPNPNGFCPVGFYVPDWWDLHDGSILPGSHSWKDEMETPLGNFGLVWGCVWGDDSRWKVQFLDLSQIQNGVLVRDDRFGYVELASDSKTHPSKFIDCLYRNGKWTIEFTTFRRFGLEDGKELLIDF